MDNFQTILIIIGVIAIIGVSIHGFLNNIKEQKLIVKEKDNEGNTFFCGSDDLEPTGLESQVDEDKEDFEQFDLSTDFDVKENDPMDVEDEVSALDTELENNDAIVTEESSESNLMYSDSDQNQASEISIDDEIEVENNIEDQAEVELEEQVATDVYVENVDEAQEKDLFIFNVVAKDGGELGGHELLQYFLTSGFRFGEMSIFHRHEHSDGTGPILFSIANMINPGTFDLDTIEQFKSEGVSFFLTAPNAEINITESFKMMLTAVEIMAEEFDCTVLNGNREPLTEAQFIEYQDRLAKYN